MTNVFNQANFAVLMNEYFNQYDSACPEIQKLMLLLYPIYYNDPSVTIVNLNHLGIGVKGTRALGAALQRNTNVIVLFLENNDITATAFASYLAPVIANHTSLRYVYLSYNSIRNAGAIALANAFKHHQKQQHQQTTKIQVLKVSCNEIGSSGAIALIESLPETVHTLTIGGNRITDDGIVNIAEKLRYNKFLRRLDIQSNSNIDYNYHNDSSVLSCSESGTKCITAFCNILQNDNRILSELHLVQPETIANQFKTAKEEELFILLRLNQIGRISFGESLIEASSWSTVLGNVTHGTKNRGNCIQKQNCRQQNANEHVLNSNWNDDNNNNNTDGSPSNLSHHNLPTVRTGEEHLERDIDDQLMYSKQQISNLITAKRLKESIYGNPNLIFSVLTSRPDLLY